MNNHITAIVAIAALFLVFLGIAAQQQTSHVGVFLIAVGVVVFVLDSFIWYRSAEYKKRGKTLSWQPVPVTSGGWLAWVVRKTLQRKKKDKQ